MAINPKNKITTIAEFRALTGISTAGQQIRCRIIQRGTETPRFDIRWFESGEGKGWSFGFSFLPYQLETLLENIEHARKILQNPESQRRS